jgi:formylglycine-generating enzyme required for sulfatase activity
MSSMMRKHLAGVLVSGFALAATASAEAQVVRAWGWNSDGQCSVPGDLGPASAIAGGARHTIALLADGTVRCWGWNNYGQCNVPGDLGPATAIAGGAIHTIALLADGTVRCWGWNDYGQCNVPGDLGPATAIAGGTVHTIALRADGTVRCWGDTTYGQCSVPGDLGTATAIAGGDLHTIALLADGTVRCWGWNGQGQCNVPGELGPATVVASGALHTLALTLTCGTPTVDRTSGNLGPIGSGTPREITFSGLPAAASAATLRVRVRSDLNLSSEFLTLRLDGVTSGTLFVTGANDCPATPDETTVTIPLKALAGYLANGALTVRLEASPLVSATQCSDGLCEISLSYEAAPVDCNANGIEDTCEVRIPGRDCNANGIPDSCDIAAGTSADVNSNGIPDSCEPDCNANNLPDSWEISQGLAPDCNANGKIDSCDIAQGLAPDCNANGRPDSCDIASGTPDCNTNGVPDSCDIAAGTSPDIDGNGVPDSCQGDCNGNGIPDTYEIVTAPWKDCDSDLVLDSCEIAANPALDCTGNGRLDSCDIATANGDCNGNGTPDSCEIANGAQDKDADGVLDDCEFARGDLDLDGIVSSADLGALLSLWGLQDPPIGDLDGDGSVSSGDLGVLLSGWGEIMWQPSIASVTPASGLASGGTTITIRGSGFDSSTTMTIGGAAATVVANPNPTTLTVTTPAGQVGFRDIVIQAAGGSATAVRAYEYLGPWFTILEQNPDPAIVTSASLRAAIAATGFAWRVRDNLTNIEMVLIPPGTFNMGCSASNQFGCNAEENPVHAVTLTNAFYMGRYEVTQAQWTARMGSNPSWFQSASAEVPAAQVPNRPVETVSWNTIAEAGGFLSNTGLRLPTEAEWEYAYRAGTTTAFHGWSAQPAGTNDDTQLGSIAWMVSSNANGQTRPVGTKSPNGFGLHDMAGNVGEWVSDWYSATYYTSSPSTNPTGPTGGWPRVVRGGSWGNVPNYLRSSFRLGTSPVGGCNCTGFRVARNP